MAYGPAIYFNSNSILVIRVVIFMDQIGCNLKPMAFIIFSAANLVQYTLVMTHTDHL